MLMPDFFEVLQGLQDPWLYLIFPLLGALCSGVAAWLAARSVLLNATPARNEKLAAALIDASLMRSTKTYELFQTLEPAKIARYLASVMNARIEEILEEIIAQRHAVLWGNLPGLLKARTYTHIRRLLPRIMANLMEDIQENIADLVQPRDLVIAKIQRDPEAFNRLLLESLAETQTAFYRSATAFGLVAGCLALVAWQFFPFWWLMPLSGFVIAAGGLFFAFQRLFWPRRAHGDAPLGLEGFLALQQPIIAERLGRGIEREFFSTHQFLEAIFSEQGNTRARNMVKRHLRPIVDEGVLKILTQVAIGAEAYVELKHAITEKVIGLSLTAVSDPTLKLQHTEEFQKLACDRLENLSHEDFCAAFQPVFVTGWPITFITSTIPGAFFGLVALGLF
ncbi:Hypothetical protein HDN1F_31820 [gamma proteobacterium HdN1]|nr:Hypothetical protein HDN1F_31820 [gamma proteobacterium HdN1]